MRPRPKLAGSHPRRHGAPRPAAAPAQSAGPPRAVGAAHRRRRALVCPRPAARAARRGATTGGVAGSRSAATGSRHAKVNRDFEITRDNMKPFGIVLVTLLASAGSSFAQLPPPAAANPPATILPSSGRNNQGGSVGATEQPVPGTTTSVNTLNPSVAISGPYSGSASSTAA